MHPTNSFYRALFFLSNAHIRHELFSEPQFFDPSICLLLFLAKVSHGTRVKNMPERFI
jgi:hypothetical protein